MMATYVRFISREPVNLNVVKGHKLSNPRYLPNGRRRRHSKQIDKAVHQRRSSLPSTF